MKNGLIFNITSLIIIEVLLLINLTTNKKIDLSKLDLLLLNFKEQNIKDNKDKKIKNSLFKRKQGDSNTSPTIDNSTNSTDNYNILSSNHSETDIQNVTKNTTDLTVEAGNLQKSIESLNKTATETTIVSYKNKIKNNY